MTEDTKVAGFEVGMLLGFDGTAPVVAFGGPPVREVKARTTVPLTEGDIGADVAIVCENGDRDKPLVLGRIQGGAQPPIPKKVCEDIVRLEAAERIELKVGRSKVILEKDGHITIRGDEVVSHAKGANSIRGGSVNLN